MNDAVGVEDGEDLTFEQRTDRSFQILSRLMVAQNRYTSITPPLITVPAFYMGLAIHLLQVSNRPNFIVTAFHSLYFHSL